MIDFVNESDHTLAGVGARMHEFITELYPICRSITGNGLRESLAAVARRIPIVQSEVPTGTQALDWFVPREWNIRSAYITAPSGERIVDFDRSNLHVVNYSTPIDADLSLEELKKHLHSLPQHPDWIPYRTSYYKEDWGFCLSHRKLESLRAGTYHVHIDSDLSEGHLTYGELLLPGETAEEVLLSSHICHPSLANDNLSGVALCTFLAQYLQSQHRRYSYRFLFAPGTIGAITWLSRNREQVTNIKHGLVVACVGDAGIMHYKRSRRGNADIDRAVVHILKHSGQQYEIRDFVPFGYDERQYCSPGFNLPVGSLTRTPSGQYPEYHTSADNLEFVKADALADSLRTYLEVIHLLETNRVYKNTRPYGEPQLGRRGLYRSLGGTTDSAREEQAMLWILNLADGNHDLLEVAQRADLPYSLIQRVATVLRENELLEEAGRGGL